MILGGLFKKIVVANYLAEKIVDPVFARPDLYGAWDAVAAVYAYAIQIYCDFSAYSDMAIGFCLLLGFHIPLNFDAPYLAGSIQNDSGGAGIFPCRLSCAIIFISWRVALRRSLQSHQSDGDFPAGRTLAWRGLDLRHLGGLHGFYLVVERLGGIIARRGWSSSGGAAAAIPWDWPSGTWFAFPGCFSAARVSATPRRCCRPWRVMGSRRNAPGVLSWRRLRAGI